MAQTILIKRSNVANKVPTNSQIIDGELALNTNDGRLYTVSGSTGSGTGTIVEIGSRSSFSTAPASPVSGQLWWDSANGTLKVWNGSAWVPSVSQLTNVSTSGNSTLGDASSDTLTVNATSTFNAPVDMNSTLNVDGAFTTTSNTTLGDSAGDALTVNATSTFNAPVDMNSTLNVDGAATFNGGVTIENGDALTFNGNAFTVARKFTVKDSSGTIVIGGWMLDTDSTVNN